MLVETTPSLVEHTQMLVETTPSLVETAPLFGSALTWSLALVEHAPKFGGNSSDSVRSGSTSVETMPDLVDAAQIWSKPHQLWRKVAARSGGVS